MVIVDLKYMAVSVAVTGSGDGGIVPALTVSSKGKHSEVLEN